jgi:putative ABC transport system permease protein
VSTMGERVRVAMLPAVTSAGAVSLVGVMALLLTALGVYATVGQAVGRREREIGIRRALGATPRAVVMLVSRHAIGLSAVGAATGLAAGLAAARALQSIVYSVSPGDPFIVLVAPVVLVCVCLAAAGIPALAAIRLDPARSLRSE